LKNFARNIITLLLSLFFCLVIIEILSRIFFPSFNPSTRFTFYHNEQGVPFAPKNFSGRMWDKGGDYDVPVTINKYGFRDRKDLRMSRPGDIFVVGDSFMFGYGVEEDKRLSNILEKKLGIPVYNIAIPGDFQDYRNLITYAQENGATVNNLIIGVCMENDLRYYYHADDQQGRSGLSQKIFSALQTLKEFLVPRSTSYNIISYTVHHNRFLLQAGLSMCLIRDVEKMGLINTPRRDWNITISDSARKLKEISAPFNTTIIIVPSRALWVAEERDAEKLFHNKFIKALKNLGLNVIDLLPYFEEDGNPTIYHFKNDGHWNERGHQKAAEVLLSYYKNNMKGPN
jgi:hypothetical protein